MLTKQRKQRDMIKFLDKHEFTLIFVFHACPASGLYGSKKYSVSEQYVFGHCMSLYRFPLPVQARLVPAEDTVSPRSGWTSDISSSWAAVLESAVQVLYPFWTQPES
jgi:hypothetical protein